LRKSFDTWGRKGSRNIITKREREVNKKGGGKRRMPSGHKKTRNGGHICTVKG